MSRILIKVCGITCPFQARAVAKQDVDAIGIILAGSGARRVTRRRAKAIVTAVAAEKAVVGVFADAPINRLLQEVRRLKLNGVQLHGNESPAYCERLRNELTVNSVGHWPTLTKAFSVGKGDTLKDVAPYTSFVDGALLDTYHPAKSGGTGNTFNWAVAGEFISRWPHLPLVVAGGLTAANVGRLVNEISPGAVDASSGLERHPGEKDLAKVAQFISQVRASNSKNKCGGDAHGVE